MPVEKKSAYIEKMKDPLDKVDALWGGTKAMREAGKTYLPKEPGEEESAWKNRRDRSTLTNVFKKTINTFAGRVFADRVSIVDASGFFAELQDNVDMEGRDLHRFCYDFGRFTLRDGLRFLLVEAPVAVDVSNLADERASNIRPYFVEIDLRSVLGWKVEDRGASSIITQFRYIESVDVPEDEFSSKSVDQIRVIEEGRVRLYRKDSRGAWLLHDDYATSTGINVVPFFADRYGYMEAGIPLLDVADKNIEHWQKSSDQSNILHVARVPILHYAGFRASRDEAGREVDVIVGPNSLVKSQDPSAKLEYVEISGASIAAGRQDIMDIEDQMVALGAEFTKRTESGREVTAAEVNSNEGGDLSELEAFAQNFKDSMYIAIGIAGDMAGEPFAGELSINTDLRGVDAPVNIPELVKLRMSRDISREGLYDVLNATWGTTLNADDEAERLQEEPQSLDMGI